MVWREDYGVSKLCNLFPKTPKRLLGKRLPQYTMAEVSKHSKKDDCWIILDGRVYDITRFIDRHPGGVGPVVNMAGKDATDVFENYHAARVYKTMLPTYLIGECLDVVVYPHVADFREARQQMLREGLFDTDYVYYGKLGSFLALLYFTSLGLSLGVVGGGGTGARMLGAAFMGIFWQQLAGLGHDLGHSGVTHNFHRDHFVGSLLSGLMGLSLSWWKSDHNTHHVVCNAVEHDPNIQHMPLLAITDKIYEKPFWDTYHKKTVVMNAIARFLVSYQHIFFYPFMALARWNLYAQVGHPNHKTLLLSDSSLPFSLPPTKSRVFSRASFSFLAAWIRLTINTQSSLASAFFSRGFFPLPTPCPLAGRVSAG
jgi:delta8-fatty-acid desaturase